MESFVSDSSIGICCPSISRWLWLCCSWTCWESVYMAPPRWGTAWSWRILCQGRPASMTSSVPSSSSSPFITCTWWRSGLIMLRTSLCCTSYTRGSTLFAMCWRRTMDSCLACGFSTSETGCKVKIKLHSVGSLKFYPSTCVTDDLVISTISNITIKGSWGMGIIYFLVKPFWGHYFLLCFDMNLQETRCWAQIQK